MLKGFLTAGLIVVLMPAAALPQQKTGKGSVYEQLNLFSEAFERIRQDAVEPVGDNKLNETEYKALKAPTSEESASPGLVVTLDNSQLKVVSPRDGSPAAAAGIKPGDLIFTIDKEPTYDLTLPEIEQKLRGPADSEVALMLRRGTGAPIETKIKRAAGKFPTVSARLEGGDVAYVRLAGFDASTAGALADAVKELRQQTGSKLIGYI